MVNDFITRFPHLFPSLAALNTKQAKENARKLQKELTALEGQKVPRSQAQEALAGGYGLSWHALMQHCARNNRPQAPAPASQLMPYLIVAIYTENLQRFSPDYVYALNDEEALRICLDDTSEDLDIYICGIFRGALKLADMYAAYAAEIPDYEPLSSIDDLRPYTVVGMNRRGELFCKHVYASSPQAAENQIDRAQHLVAGVLEEHHRAINQPRVIEGVRISKYDMQSYRHQ